MEKFESHVIDQDLLEVPYLWPAHKTNSGPHAFSVSHKEQFKSQCSVPLVERASAARRWVAIL